MGVGGDNWELQKGVSKKGESKVRAGGEMKRALHYGPEQPRIQA